MNACDLTMRLHGSWYGYYGSAPCPVCQPEAKRSQTGLTLADGDDGRLLLHCKRGGCAFEDILAAAGVTSGGYRLPDPAVMAERKAERQRQERRKADQAERCWCEAKPIEGTLAEIYLRTRAITCPLPPTLRFHPACWHGPTAKRFPAMVARIDGISNFAVHRTYLLPDGTGKAALRDNKLMLGPARGGAVGHTDGHLRIAVAEGIETALSLSCGLLREPASVWATLSTSGMTGLDLPRRPGHLTIASDGDSAGRKAAFTLAERATALSWKVDFMTAPDGCDWNDILQMEAAK